MLECSRPVYGMHSLMDEQFLTRFSKVIKRVAKSNVVCSKVSACDLPMFSIGSELAAIPNVDFNSFVAMKFFRNASF